MATLNTLRTKGGPILAVVIGLSLLAFLLGDLSSSGSVLLNSSNMVVGEIDGDDISVEEYQYRVNELTRINKIMTGSDATGEQQQTAIRNQAWDKIIREVTIEPSIEDLGLTVYDEEALDMADGEHISPLLQSIFVSPESGIFDQNLMRNFVSNLDQDPSGNSRYLWSYLEREMASERELSKYITLVSNGIFVTDLEVEQGIKATDVKYSIEYVTKSFTSVADSLVTPTEAQLKEFYNKNKESFRQSDGREIEYVSFEALPSESDYAEADKYMKTLADEFRASEDVAQFVALNSEEQFNTRFMAESEITTPSVAEFAFAEEKGAMLGPIFANDTYRMYRIADIKELPDSVGARSIVLAPGSKVLADSLAAVVRSNKSKFADMVAEYSLDKNTPGGDMGRFDPQMLPVEMSSELIAAKKGDIKVIDSQFGTLVLDVTYVGNKSKKVQLAEVVYNVVPSNQTEQQAYSNATTFMAEAGAKGFETAVSEASLSKRISRLRAGDRNISGLDQSTEIVRWAFDSEKGAVSDVFTVGGTNVVAYVASVQEFGIAPFESVRSDLDMVVLNENKKEYITKEMEGASSLEDLAAKLGTTVESASDVTYNMYFIPSIGIAPAVIGSVGALSDGQLSKPVASVSGVVVAKLVSKSDSGETTAEAEKVLLTTNAQTQIAPRAIDAIYRLNNIRDMRVKFF